MTIKITAIAVGLAIGVVSGLAIANVNEKMADMFGQQANFTRPGSAQGAMRGVVTGGSATIRNPIIQPSGFSFDPPSVSAGCGGIDLYGGNLSFPSKEQYIATARAVVANVGGYAFRSALSYVCEKCEAVMSAVQDTVNALNMDNMNSCQIAQGIVDGSIDDSVKNSAEKLSASWKETRGDSKDFFSSFNAGKGKERPTTDASRDPEMSKITQGNWTWDSMAKTEVFDWLGSDRKTREEVMTLLGTVVACTPGVNDCEGEGEELVVRVLAPKLRLHDFVAPADQATKKHRIYTCQDDACLKVNLATERNLGASVTQRIIDTLLGADGKPGVLERMKGSASVAGALSERERLLIENVPDIVGPAVACLNAGDGGDGHARRIVTGLAPVVAADALYRATNQSLQTIIADLSSRTKAAGALQAVEMLNATKADLAAQHKDIYEASKAHDLLLDSIQRCGRNPVALATSPGVK